MLFSQGDAAEDIFFLFHGNIDLYTDLSELVDMKPLVRDDGSFNVKFMSFANGAYLGDNDVLLGLSPIRSDFAVTNSESVIYSIKNHRLTESLEDFESLRRSMDHIAKQKYNYYKMLRD